NLLFQMRIIGVPRDRFERRTSVSGMWINNDHGPGCLIPIRLPATSQAFRSRWVVHDPLNFGCKLRRCQDAGELTMIANMFLKGVARSDPGRQRGYGHSSTPSFTATLLKKTCIANRAVALQASYASLYD